MEENEDMLKQTKIEKDQVWKNVGHGQSAVIVRMMDDGWEVFYTDNPSYKTTLSERYLLDNCIKVSDTYTPPEEMSILTKFVLVNGHVLWGVDVGRVKDKWLRFYPAEVEGLKVKRIMDGEVNLQISHVVYRETYNIKKYVYVK